MTRERRFVPPAQMAAASLPPSPWSGWSVLDRLAWHQATCAQDTVWDDAAGARLAEYRLISGWRFKLDDYGMTQAAELADEMGVRFSSLNWLGGFTASDRSSFLMAVDDALSALEAAIELRVPYVVAVPGGRSGHTWSHARRMVIPGLKQLADKAGEFGLVVALSPVDVSFCRQKSAADSIRWTRELLGEMDHPALAANLSTHRVEPSEEWFAEVRELVPWIRNVQIHHDSVDSANKTGCRFPWAALVGPLVELLESRGYRGAYDVIHSGPGSWFGEDDSPHKLIRQCFVEQVLSLPAMGPQTGA